ncbi:MFS transporter [Micromonospora carbonacea]|uniref:MFS transporter n=1 Tax=Micromonospora carbonacea TaxID=47853 RepID=UPI003D753A5A
MTTVRPSRFLINREYARLWCGQAVSMVGDYVFSTTLVLWVATVLAKDQPWGPAAVSGILLSVSAAVLGVGPVAGVFVDRWNALRTMLGTEVIRGGTVMLLALLSLLPTDALPVWLWLGLIYVVVFVLHANAQFFAPARMSIIRDIVTGQADRARAAGIAQATAGTAAIVGPPLAAPLLITAGLPWALLVNAASYAVSYVIIRSTGPGLSVGHEEAGPRPGVRAEFVAGLRFFRGSQFLVALLTIVVIGQMGTGALNTLNVFFLTDNLGAPSESYGYLGTAIGVGAILGALAAGSVVARLGAWATTWVGLVTGGVLLFAYSRQTTLTGGMILLFLSIVPITALNTAISPLMLAAAPREYTGRVMAVFQPVTQLASMLAAVASGWLASSALRDFAATVGGVRLGPIDVILAVAAGLIVLAGLYARAMLPRSEAQPATDPRRG